MSAGLSMSEEELRALPVSVPLVVAARAFGMAAGKARELARANEFPCRVIQVGARYRVPKSALLTALGVETHAAAVADTRQTTAERSADDAKTTRQQLRAIG